MKLGLMLIVTIFCLSAKAQLFQITNRSGICVGIICDLLEDEVNSNLPDADQTTYLEGIANSAVIASKGSGLDYTFGNGVFAFGVSVGSGVALGDRSLSDVIGGDVEAEEFAGFSSGASIFLGLNTGLFFGSRGRAAPGRLNVFINYLSVDAPASDSLEGKSTFFGLHFQYQLFKKSSSGLGIVRWGGLDLNFGVEWNKFNLRLSQSLIESVESAGQVANFNGNIEVGADVNVYTFPIELSTHISFLGLFSIVGGVGADFSFGSAESIARLDSTVTISAGGGGAGEGVLDLGLEGSPEFFQLRGFVGPEVSVGPFKLAAQVNYSFKTNTAGLNLRTGLTW